MSGVEPKLRFDGFDGGWLKCSVSDFATFAKGKGISKADIAQDGATSCIRYGELYTTYGTLIDEVVSATNVDENDLRLSLGGEVIIPASGETSEDIATAAVVRRSGVALGGDLNIVTSKQDGYFLASYFSGKKRMALASKAQGNSVVHLYPSQIGSLEINLPTLPEQQKIAAFLGAVDSKLAALRRKQAGLERFKAGLMQRLFSQKLRFARDDGSAFPDWEETAFEKLATRVGEQFDPRKDEGAPRVIEMENIESETGRLQGYSAIDGQISLKNRFRAGDVLFGKLRPYLKKFARPDFDGVCSSEIWVLRGKRGVANSFVHVLVQSPRFIEVVNVSSGSKMPRADWKTVANTDFPLPHPDEQRKIADALTALDTKITATAAQITKIERFKQGLLQQMFV